MTPPGIMREARWGYTSIHFRSPRQGRGFVHAYKKTLFPQRGLPVHVIKNDKTGLPWHSRSEGICVFFNPCEEHDYGEHTLLRTSLATLWPLTNGGFLSYR